MEKYTFMMFSRVFYHGIVEAENYAEAEKIIDNLFLDECYIEKGDVESVEIDEWDENVEQYLPIFRQTEGGYEVTHKYSNREAESQLG